MTITILCPSCRTNVGRYVELFVGLKYAIKIYKLLNNKPAPEIESVHCDILNILDFKDCCRTRLLTYYSLEDIKYTDNLGN